MSNEWEERYRKCDTPWDRGAPAPPLLDWLEKNGRKVNGRVLAPGCGTGHDAKAIALRCPQARVVGVDIAPAALSKAAKEQKPIPPNLEFREQDFFEIASGADSGAYDWIWEHTCFCAIDPARRSEYVETAHAALKTDGILLGVFYLDPYDEEHQPGDGPPFGSELKELEARFFDSGKFRQVESYLPEVSYSGREGREWFLRAQKV